MFYGVLHVLLVSLLAGLESNILPQAAVIPEQLAKIRTGPRFLVLRRWLMDCCILHHECDLGALEPFHSRRGNCPSGSSNYIIKQMEFAQAMSSPPSRILARHQAWTDAASFQVAADAISHTRSQVCQNPDFASEYKIALRYLQSFQDLLASRTRVFTF